MRNKRKIVFNIVFLVLCVGLTLYYVFRGQDFSQVYTYVAEAKGVEWLVGIGLVVCFILSESVIIYYLMRSLRQKPIFGHCCLYSFVGFFFSLITPTASGGQPMQMVFMKKDKLPLHVSTLALMIVTIAYKAVLVIIGAVVLAVRPQKIMTLLNPVMFWVWLGIGLNVICVGFMVALVLCPVLTKKMVMKILAGLSRILPLRNGRWERITKKASHYMDEYKEASAYIKTNIRITVHVLLMSILQRVFLFAVTYVVFRSFGIQGLNLIEVILLQGVISLAVDMLPLPGGMGISEHLFRQIFLPICGAQLIVPAMVVSRGLSFYAQLLMSACLTLAAYLIIFGKRENKR